VAGLESTVIFEVYQAATLASTEPPHPAPVGRGVRCPPAVNTRLQTETVNSGPREVAELRTRVRTSSVSLESA
jgi:hypothetical protein